MANYENGTFTRQAIIDACAHLFYEKGFHETSYSDICEHAHVNRGTIYYHFETKESIRYAVQNEYKHINMCTAKKYCADTRYLCILSMYMQWCQYVTDENMRKFALQLCLDTPIYTGKVDGSHFYSVAYDEMWGGFWEKKNISQLAFATVYGYLVSCMRLLCEYPDKYNPCEFFEHCVKASTEIWGITNELMDEIWQNVEHYIELIHEDEYRTLLDIS